MSTAEAYVLEPLEARPNEAADFYRERQDWIIAILTERRLTPFQRVIGVLIMMHMSAQSGQCNPSITRIAALLGASENTVRDALKAIKALGYWDYPPNRGGQGRSHQFTFLVTPNQAGGLANKPPTRVERSARSKTPNPPICKSEPTNLGSRTPQFVPPKPPSPVGGNYLTNSKTNCIREQRAFASQTAPMSTSEGLKKANGSKEESKGTSERSKPQGRAQLDCIENGIAYVAVTDHETKLRVIEQNDRLLDRLRSENPGVQVKKISTFIAKPCLKGGAT